MGQYYKVLIKYPGGKKTNVYDPEDHGRKLMEFSFLWSEFMDFICKEIEDNGSTARICTIGDYAEEEEEKQKHPKIKSFIESFFKNKNKNTQYNCKGIKFSYSGKLLVNYELGEYVDLDEYIKLNSDEENNYCVHPLSLLTAMGNGNGGGDYFGIDENYVGRWAGHMITIEKKSDTPISNLRKLSLRFIDE